MLNWRKSIPVSVSPLRKSAVWNVVSVTINQTPQDKMANSKKYWKGFDDLMDTPVAQQMAENEFPDSLPTTEFLGDQNGLEQTATSRRDFLKFLGFSTAAATLAACEAPVVESIPYVVKPEEIIPGVPNYYASSIFSGGDFASVLIKTREGRPIKLEPNKDATFNGSTNARIQASVLSLYDSNRLRGPQIEGASSDWSTVIKETKMALEKANGSGKQVVLLTGTTLSVFATMGIEKLKETYENFVHIAFDLSSASGKLDFYEKVGGARALPTYNLKKADVIVGVNADFLGEFTGQQVAGDYATRRKPGKGMSKHYQFESLLTLTGSSADKRIQLKPSEQASALTYLYAKLGGGVQAPALRADLTTSLDAAAQSLKAAKGKSLVLAGGADEISEALAFGINQLLGNVGTTVQTEVVSYLAQGDVKAFQQFLKDAEAGKVGMFISWGTNPVHDFAGIGFGDIMERLGTTVAICDLVDETASLCKYQLPLSHPLESWSVNTPTNTTVAMSQPAIAKLFDSMQGEEILAAWLGMEKTAYQLAQKAYESLDADKSFNEALHDGEASFSRTGLQIREVDYAVYAKKAVQSSIIGGTEIVFYKSTAMGAGSLINNPWLQEFPDPITRVSWDNYLLVGPGKAEELGLKMKTESNGAVNGNYVTVSIGNRVLENVPVFVQPGLAPDTVGLAVGYGRSASGKAGDGVGVNAAKLMEAGMDFASGVTIEKSTGMHPFACIQLAHTMMGRKIVNETSLDNFLNGDHKKWNKKTLFETHKGQLTASETTLWAAHDHETGHMWNMSIDLTSCIGCGACVIACNAENNVPVVGKDEMRRHRDMHWLRIDRYYSSDMTDEVAEAQGVGGISKFAKMEIASDNPEVVFQPVMCQHCNNAPCETVCPVAATVHSAEGLNHMAYNRCIGTRYCANNCPYKVRRFNWFQYEGNPKFKNSNPSMDDYGRMVLNPDVTVRARGVMEKCSFCIQRIQYAKLEAKKNGRMVKDGEFTTACAQACGTGALVFGDINDKNSEVAALKQDNRMYHLLEDVGTEPSVFYQTKVRNLS
jgi:MoCo/4Fe-4S cofactor protein with predicted Tat translocation signal